MNSLEFNLPTISIEELNKIKKEKLEVILDDEDIKEKGFRCFRILCISKNRYDLI